ncbi:MAG: undecaprenyl-diphosphatase UppP [Candidatus Omnitrophota bacterium]
MTLWQAVVLGIVQGLTEFLPVSSSGHLVLFQNLFGMKEPMLAFDITLHGGTLLALVAFFRRDILDILKDFISSLQRTISKKPASVASVQPPHRGLWVCILITLVPTGIMAVCFKHLFETAFANLVFVAAAWFVMGILLILSERFQKGQKDLSVIHYGDAFWIGLVQGIALLPGVSRSGSTILAGMLLGIKKEDAAKFSFLISIPAVAGAIVMDLKEGIQYFSANEAVVLAGFLAAAVTGYFVIRWLMGLIRKGHFFLFGYYCIAVSFFAWIIVILS